MKVRLANRKDAQAIVEFNQAMALETEGKHLDPNILRSGVEAVFANPKKGFYVVAEDAGRIAGGLMITFEWSDWRNKWFWWIQSVYILPESRGNSLYRQMYEFVTQMAAERGDVRGFRLYVEKENTDAQRVYEKVGMEGSNYLMFEQKI